MVKAQKPNNCLGKRTEPTLPLLEQWKHQAKVYLQLQRMPEDLKLALTTTFLRGEALTWWLNRQQAVQQRLLAPYQSVDELFNGLAAQFVPIEAWQKARDKLARLSQRTLVAAYSEEFLSLILTIPDMTEQDRVDTYVRGLKFGPRKEVMLRRCRTLDDTMAVADRTNAIYSTTRDWTPIPTTSADRVGATNATDGPTPMELGQLQTEFQGYCFTCGAWGHRNSECPQQFRGRG